MIQRRGGRSEAADGSCVPGGAGAGPVWYAKFRLPDGRQVQKKLGSAWTGRGRPAAGCVTKRLAEDWLRGVLEEARRGTLPGMVQTGATFADAAAEWLRYVEHDRARKPSTVAGYRVIVRSQLLTAFGTVSIESVTPATIAAWLGSLVGQAASSRIKSLVLMHGIFQRARKVWGLAANPVAEVEKPPLLHSGDIDVFSPEEVWGAGPRGRIKAGRRDPPHRGVHGAAAGGAAGVALA